MFTASSASKAYTLDFSLFYLFIFNSSVFSYFKFILIIKWFVSYAEVLNEFATKKCVKLGKLLKDGGGLELKSKKKRSKKTGQETGRTKPNSDSDPKEDGANDTVSACRCAAFDHYNNRLTGCK